MIKSYNDNILNINISSVKDFNNNCSNLNMTKLIFYDYSMEKVDFKKMNEIFIEIDSKYINGINLKEEENDKEEFSPEKKSLKQKFLGNKRHLFTRFIRRNGIIYIFNFIGFEKEITNGKKKNKNGKKFFTSLAYFQCENERCKAVYTYSFKSNKFIEKKCHSENPHNIIKDVPEYYKQNINLFREKKYITDIQLIRVND